jgi:hypothetical protein
LQLPGPGGPPAAEQAPVPPPTPAAAASVDQPAIFLIALQDSTIRPAIAYWVQGDTLNYVTVTRVLNRISLALVDRDLTNQLNGERNVPFRLLAAR